MCARLNTYCTFGCVTYKAPALDTHSSDDLSFDFTNKFILQVPIATSVPNISFEEPTLSER